MNNQHTAITLSDIPEAQNCGAALFDGQNRLIEANDLFAETLPTSLDEMSSGRLSLFDILARAVAQGHITPAEDRQDWQKQLLLGWSRHGSIIDLPLKSGQSLKMQRLERPDGLILALLILDDISAKSDLEPSQTDAPAPESPTPETIDQETLPPLLDAVQEGDMALPDFKQDIVQLALEALPVAMSVFDQQQKLCLANKHYSDFFQLPPELTAPATDYRALLEHKAAHGHFIAGTYGETDPAKIINARLEKLSEGCGFTGEYENQQGQRIETRCVPLPGGGFVEICAEATGNESDDWFQEMVRYDDLTGLANRTYFRALVDEVVQKALTGHGDMGAILCLKMDNMHEVNDFLGYGRGDHVLRSLADRLQELAGEGGRVARLGDVKFALIVPGLADEGAAAIFAERLHQQLSTHPIVIEDGLEVDIVTAIGVTRYPENGTDPNDLIRQAEMALVRAKDVRNRQFSYHTGMREKANRLGRLTHDLRHALERRELKAFYQPKVDLRSGKIIGMEALMRWQHPDRGMIPPSEFIPVAERTGLIAPLTNWMLKEACGQTRAWKDAGLADLKCAVNLSTVHFRRQSVVNSVTQALDDTGLDPENLEIEITESVLMAEDDVIKETFSWFQALGIPVAIDDFGTGYSSLAYLQRFPVDKVKIDASFVMRLHENEDDAAICRAVISLAHNLGMAVVAEGIEEQEHIAFLRQHHCDEGQGYYFGRPMPASALEELLSAGDNGIHRGFF